MSFFDTLETRSADERAADLARALPEQIARAKTAAGYAALLDGVDPAAVTSAGALAQLPVLRKSELSRAQAENPPFGGFTVKPAHEIVLCGSCGVKLAFHTQGAGIRQGAAAAGGRSRI